MRKIALPVLLGIASMVLMPTAAYAHGGDVLRDYVHVIAGILGAPVVCMCAVLALTSACLLRGNTISRWRAAYGILAIILSVAGVGFALLCLLQGGLPGLAYSAVVLGAGWWSVRMAGRVVRKNSGQSSADGSAGGQGGHTG